MATMTPSQRRRRTLIMMGIGFVTLAVFAVALGAMKGRDAGLSVAQALVFGLRHAWLNIAVAAVVFLLYWMVYSAYVDRAPVAAPNAVEAGGERWRRMRLLMSIVFALSVAIMCALLGASIVVHGWQRDDLVLLLLFLAYAAGLIPIWVRKPSPGYLYALETGDASRTNDERAQMVQGKAAGTTVWILVALVYIGGSLFEAIVLAQFPWRSFATAGAVFLIYAASGMYWDRKL